MAQCSKSKKLTYVDGRLEHVTSLGSGGEGKAAESSGNGPVLPHQKGSWSCHFLLGEKGSQVQVGKLLKI